MAGYSAWHQPPVTPMWYLTAYVEVPDALKTPQITSGTVVEAGVTGIPAILWLRWQGMAGRSQKLYQTLFWENNRRCKNYFSIFMFHGCLSSEFISLLLIQRACLHPLHDNIWQQFQNFQKCCRHQNPLIWGERQIPRCCRRVTCSSNSATDSSAKSHEGNYTNLSGPFQ